MKRPFLLSVVLVAASSPARPDFSTSFPVLEGTVVPDVLYYASHPFAQRAGEKYIVGTDRAFYASFFDGIHADLQSDQFGFPNDPAIEQMDSAVSRSFIETRVAAQIRSRPGGPASICSRVDTGSGFADGPCFADDRKEFRSPCLVAPGGLDQYFLAFNEWDWDPSLSGPANLSRIAGSLPAIRIYDGERGSLLPPNGLTGRYPRLAIDGLNGSTYHLVYYKGDAGGGNLVYASSPDGAAFSEEDLGSYAIAGDAVRLKADGDHFLHLAFLAGGDLYYGLNTNGSFGSSAPPSVVARQVKSFSFDVDLAGTAYIAIEDTKGDTSILSAARGSAFTTYYAFPDAGEYRAPYLAIDSWNYPEILYLSPGGEVRVTSSAPAPAPALHADVLSGEWPLAVSFTVSSVGPILEYDWDFGDGTTAAGRSMLQTHVYDREGDYAVALHAVGPGGSADIVEDGAGHGWIHVGSSTFCYTLRCPNAYPGRQGVRGEVLMTQFDDHADGLQGAITWDPAVIHATSLAPTALISRGADFVNYQIAPDKGYGLMFVLVNFKPPFGHPRYLPAGRDLAIAGLEFDVDAAAAIGSSTAIRFQTVNWSSSGSSGTTENLVIVSGASRYPALRGKTLGIYDRGRFFLRGDADGDGDVTLTDAIAILGFLFLGTPIAERRAADVDASGDADLTDAVDLLFYLFLGGSPPAPPFPQADVDPASVP